MRERGVLRCAGLACASFLIAPAVTEAAWNQPVGGLSPINQSPTQNAQQPSLTVIGGVPWVAWSEADGSGAEIRVSRLNAAGTAWEQVVGGTSPINHGAGANPNAVHPSLAAIGGVPHVAWTESDGTNNEIRVSRLNAAGTDWQQVVGGASPINQSATVIGSEPSLTDVGGVPYVAWSEHDGTNSEIRVSRLNAAGNDWEQPWPAASAIYGGINASSSQHAGSPSLTTIGGVPYVAWTEEDGSNTEVRVSRLNGANWQQVVGGASPINQAPTLQDAKAPSLTAVGGVPHVAWAEADGNGDEIRVSRLIAGAFWQQVVGGASPINDGTASGAAEPSLTGIGSVPYVAWREFDGGNNETRVSRLNAAGTDWEELVGGPNPINHGNGDSQDPSLTANGGVPYVAWREPDGTNAEIRVSRLEPELTAPEALATDDGAVLLARVRSYGVEYPVAFEYGPGVVLSSRTAVTTSSGDRGNDTVFRTVGGLTPATAYSYRATGFDGTYSITPTATAQFTTDAQNGPGPQGSPGPQGPEGPGGANGLPGTNGPRGEPAIRLLVAVVNTKLRARAGKRVRVDYLSTAAGSSTLEVLKGRKRVARITSTAKVGRNRIAWNGKQGRKKAKAGKYTLRLTATGGDGQVATDTGTVTLKR